MMKTESKQDLRDKVDMLEEEVESLEKDKKDLEARLEDLSERYEINKKSRDHYQELFSEKRYIAKDGFELLDDMSMNDFAILFSHFSDQIRFSVTEESDNDTRGPNVMLKIDWAYDPIPQGGNLFLNLYPSEHFNNRLKILPNGETHGKD
jgi:predicted nuclease with TOPRIM domain